MDRAAQLRIPLHQQRTHTPHGSPLSETRDSECKNSEVLRNAGRVERVIEARKKLLRQTEMCDIRFSYEMSILQEQAEGRLRGALRPLWNSVRRQAAGNQVLLRPVQAERLPPGGPAAEGADG
jgi:hypothetical protein